MVGQKFQPEWLIRVKRVYWTENGALWADATVPTSPGERAFTVEKIRLKLAEYVTNGAKRDWRGLRPHGGADHAGEPRPIYLPARRVTRRSTLLTDAPVDVKRVLPLVAAGRAARRPRGDVALEAADDLFLRLAFLRMGSSVGRQVRCPSQGR